jgi:hypothetical protein
VPSQAPSAARRPHPHLGQAQLKGQVPTIPGHLIRHRGGQHRRVADDRHRDIRKALRPPPQIRAGVAGDVVLIAKDLAAEGGPSQARMDERAQRRLVPGGQRRGTAQGRLDDLLLGPHNSKSAQAGR